MREVNKVAELGVNKAVELILDFGPNCLLGICCPPSQQAEVLAVAIENDLGWDNGKSVAERRATSELVANWILNHFDLAPKDSIAPLLRKAGELALNR